MAVISEGEIFDKIKNSLKQIRPFLEEDGGDLELIEVTDDMVVKIELKGACKTCSMSNMTFEAGVEETIRKAVPEVRKVVAVNTPSLEN